MKKNKLSAGEKSLKLHRKFKGKFQMSSKMAIETMDDLSVAYTPGVGAVSSYIAENKEEAPLYTMKGNTIAIVSDGSAVLGLGNLGPEAALPVMEGKAAIFKKFAGLDAVPIVLATQDTQEIIKTIKAISPGFGGINLEDIAAPRCFEIEEALKKELTIPVMHDDQHGTAVVILAGLLNALKVVGKDISKIKIVMSGAGAAGTAIAKLILQERVSNIVICDRDGVIHKGRENLSREKLELAAITNPNDEEGSLAEALLGADVFIGVSGPGLVSRSMVSSMAKDPIIFALANPVPEIMPEEALAGGAKVVATGRSDFPNQLNNALVFPGVFRGALDYKVLSISDDMKRAAAYAIAGLVKKPVPKKIVPDIFDRRIVNAVAKAMRSSFFKRRGTDRRAKGRRK